MAREDIAPTRIRARLLLEAIAGGSTGTYDLVVFNAGPIPQAVRDDINVPLERDALHVERIGMGHEHEAVPTRSIPHLADRRGAQDGPIGGGKKPTSSGASR